MHFFCEIADSSASSISSFWSNHQAFPKWMHYFTHSSRVIRVPPLYFYDSVSFQLRLTRAILTSLRWNLKIILVRIFLVCKDIVHFKKHVLGICISFDNFLFSSIAHFYEIIYFIHVLNYLYISDTNSLLDKQLESFSHSVGCLFIS